MSAEPDTPMSEEDKMAAEWAAALSESKPAAGNEVASEVAAASESVAAVASRARRPMSVIRRSMG